MQVHDVPALTRSMPTLDLRRRPTHEEAMASTLDLGELHGCQLGVARFSGQPPWERHAGDELIHVLEGEVRMTLRTEGGFEERVLGAGSVVVVPAGTWHRSNAPERATVLAATPREGNEHSHAPDPLLAE